MLKWLLVLAVIWAAWRLLRPGPPRPRGALGRARALLGVEAGADAAAIRAAHRRQVAAVHPDRGGSAERTRDLNAARDLLLRGR